MVYALLVERAEAMDRHMWALSLTNGSEKEKPSDLFDDLSHRAHLDQWLEASMGPQAAAEAALVQYLRA